MTTTLIIAASLIALLVWLSFLYRVPDMSHLDAPEAPLVKAPEHISEAHHEVIEKLRDYHSAPLAKNAQEARRRFHAVFSRPVSIEPVPVDAGGVPAEWIVAEGADPDRRLLYIHGGAFIVGSPETHRHITSEISRKTGTAVLAIDYRMRPEHKLTAAQQDTRTACQWMLEQGPSIQGAPAKLFIAGDSAGGNLALSLLTPERNWRLLQKAVIFFLCALPTTGDKLLNPEGTNGSSVNQRERHGPDTGWSAAEGYALQAV